MPLFGSKEEPGVKLKSVTRQPTTTVRQIYIAPPSSRSGMFTSQAPDPEAGFNICGVCRVCTCMHNGFIKTPTGIIKTLEVVIGFVCLFLLFKYEYGLKYARDLGMGYSVIVTAASACALTSAVLLFCYMMSASTYARVRPSLFEVAFNYVCCGLYIGASTLLATQVHFELYHSYLKIAGFSAYPAMTAVYVLGYVVGVLHGIDGSMALKFMRTQR